MGPIGCPETSVRNYHCSLRNNPQERISHVNRVKKSGTGMAKSAPRLGVKIVLQRRPRGTPDSREDGDIKMNYEGKRMG